MCYYMFTEWTQDTPLFLSYFLPLIFLAKKESHSGRITYVLVVVYYPIFRKLLLLFPPGYWRLITYILI